MATVLYFAWREKLQVVYENLQVLYEIKSTYSGPIRLQYLLQL